MSSHPHTNAKLPCRKTKSPIENFLATVLHRSKIPLCLGPKLRILRSLVFRQQDGVNSVVR